MPYFCPKTDKNEKKCLAYRILFYQIFFFWGGTSISKAKCMAVVYVKSYLIVIKISIKNK